MSMNATSMPCATAIAKSSPGRNPGRVRIFVVLGLLSACSKTQQSTPVNNSAVYAAFASGTSRVEVSVAGNVTRTLGMRTGRSGTHEGFLMQADGQRGLVLRVEDNVDLTGPIPLRNGEHVIVHGEYEYYPRGGVIHWTHHDPAGRHESGYIEVVGKRYQ